MLWFQLIHVRRICTGSITVTWWRHQMETFPRCRPFVWECHRWIPLTKASDAELWCFLWSSSKQSWAGDLKRSRAHYDVTVMTKENIGSELHYQKTCKYCFPSSKKALDWLFANASLLISLKPCCGTNHAIYFFKVIRDNFRRLYTVSWTIRLCIFIHADGPVPNMWQSVFANNNDTCYVP